MLEDRRVFYTNRLSNFLELCERQTTTLIYSNYYSDDDNYNDIDDKLGPKLTTSV